MKTLKQTIAHTASDPTIEFTELELDGEVYKLVFSFNSICQVEAMTGLNLLSAIRMGDLTSSQFRAVLYASMLTAHPDITIEYVGSLIGFDTLNTITEALTAAWTASLDLRKKRVPTIAE